MLPLNVSLDLGSGCGAQHDSSDDGHGLFVVMCYSGSQGLLDTWTQDNGR